jgi:hypothetical protein
VAAKVAIDYRLFRIAAHAGRAHDVARALGIAPMLDLGGAHRSKYLVMGSASRGKPRLDVFASR